MNSSPHKWMQIGIAAAILALLASTCFGQVIRLQRAVTVQPRQDVRLGDIATVTGVDRRTAEALSNTVILSGVDSSRQIKAESILMALVAQDGVAALGNGLKISGAAECDVHVVGDLNPTMSMNGLGGEKPLAQGKLAIIASELTSQPALLPATVVSLATAPTPALASSATASPNPAKGDNTLAKLIVERAQQELKLPADDVRVTFETINPFLDHPIPATRRWFCRPLTRTLLGTVQFEAQLVEGTKVVERLTVQTKIECRQQVVLTTTKLERGDVVSPEQVRVEETWLDRKMPTLFAEQKDVIGLEAQRAIAIGGSLDQRDFKPAMMASKNDPLTVIYAVGSLQVQMRGRAMEDGKLHDQIQVRNETTGEKYQAVLIGKRMAVVGGTLTVAEEKKLRESL